MTIRKLPSINVYIWGIAITILLLSIFSIGVLINQVQYIVNQNELELVQSDVNIESENHDLSGATFATWNTETSQKQFANLAQGLRENDDILSVVLFALDGTVVWTDNPSAEVGKKYEPEDVAEAIDEGIHSGIASQTYIDNLKKLDVVAVDEVYAPIHAKNGKVVGVIEVYIDNSIEMQQVRWYSWLVLVITLGVVGAISFLLWILFSKQNHFIEKQAEEIKNFAEGLENEVKIRTQAYTDSEARYKKLVDGANVGIIRTSLKGDIIYVNKSYVKILGYDSQEEVLKQKAKDLYADASEREKILTAVKQGNGVVENYEIHLRTKQGETRVILVNVTTDGDMLNGMGIDITERKLLSKRTLELDQLKSRFITIFSHATRTPLNEIRWNVEALLSGEFGKMKKEQETFLQRVMQSEGQILRLIRNMNTVLDIDRKTLMLEKIPSSLVSLVHEVAESYKSVAKLKNIKLVVQKKNTSDQLIDMDSTKIRGVIESVIDNAIQYSTNGTVIKVDVTVDAQKEKAVIQVADKGVGIPQAEEKMIFDRFVRGSNAQSMNPNGVGISLYIAKAIVTAHNGDISLSSKLNEGTTCTIKIPFKDDAGSF